MNTQRERLSLLKSEDWWAVWLGTAILLVALTGVVGKVPKMGSWTDRPLDSFYALKRSVPLAAMPDDLVIGKTLGKQMSYDKDERVLVYKGVMSAAKRDELKTLSTSTDYIQAVDALYVQVPSRSGNIVASLLVLSIGLGVITAVVVGCTGGCIRDYGIGFVGIFLLAIAAEIVAKQEAIAVYGIEYAFWALLLGLLISNTVGVPKTLLAAAKTELFIKTGLVLLGAEVLFNKILQIGLPGLFVAWLVTPIVIIFMYVFGVRFLKMASRSFVMTIAAATSVCGVSAAIATAAACRAKKEELTLAVGMSLIFTVLMMVFMPVLIRYWEMAIPVGAAWMGGTIDSTGAVVLAGSVLGAQAEAIAAVVKMIQNILIGVVAFCVALYWVTTVERDTTTETSRPSLMEVWNRFPKFVVGFLATSLLFSFVVVPWNGALADRALGEVSTPVRGWLFCLAFVSIGLESNFRDLSSNMVGGKPFVLYIVGQTFNLILTLIAAYLAFGGILFAVPNLG